MIWIFAPTYCNTRILVVFVNIIPVSTVCGVPYLTIYTRMQDDSISDEEGIKKYAEYKLEFKRQQLNEFFVTHKEEEWFKQKYHPDDSTQRKEELKVGTICGACA